MRARRIAGFAALALILAGVAGIASKMRMPDTFFYTRAAEKMITPGCAEIHCFRVLVPWIVGAVPGPSVLKWKTYSVLANAAAALAVFDLSLLLGLSARTAAIAAALTGLGFGSFYTLWEPFDSDPLMFWLTPLVLRWALEARFAAATTAASIGVFAKEIVVAPFAIVAIVDAWERRWPDAFRAVRSGAIAFAVWFGLHVFLRFVFDYSYGANTSPHIFSGAGLVPWLHNMSGRGALSAMFNEFGAPYLLFPFGFLAAPPKLRRLAVASLPFACIFAYVQQPDRALWNFHFVTSPLAALALEPMADAFVVCFLAVYAFANLKVGAQVPWIPHARYAFAIGLVLAGVAGWRTVRRR